MQDVKPTRMRERVKEQSLIIALTLALILLIPIILVTIVLPSVLVRSLVVFAAKLFRSDLVGPMNDGSIMMAALESPRTRDKCSFILYIRCDKTVPLEGLREQVTAKLLKLTDDKGGRVYQKFCQRWTPFCGFMFWQWNRDFNIQNHVRPYDYDQVDPELRLPQPATEADIQRVAGFLISQPWPNGQSPWEFLIIPCRDELTENEYSAIVVRMHHGLADGYSLLKMVLKLTDSESVSVPKPVVPTLNRWRRLALPLATAVRLPYDFANYIVSAYDGPNDWHLIGTKLSRKYNTFYGEFPVENIKLIRRKWGTSYSAALYAIVVGTIRRMMLESGQELPPTMSLLIPFPRPDHPGGLCNHFNCVAIKASLSLGTADERLGEMTNKFERLRNTPTAHIASSWYASMLSLLPIFVVKLMHKWLITIVVSSLPGPEKEIEWEVGGTTTRLTTWWGACGHVTGNMGAIACMISMAGIQRIVFTLDRMIFANHKVPQDFQGLLNQEIQELLLLESSKGASLTSKQM